MGAESLVCSVLITPVLEMGLHIVDAQQIVFVNEKQGRRPYRERGWGQENRGAGCAEGQGCLKI